MVDLIHHPGKVQKAFLLEQLLILFKTVSEIIGDSLKRDDLFTKDVDIETKILDVVKGTREELIQTDLLKIIVSRDQDHSLMFVKDIIAFVERFEVL